MTLSFGDLIKKEKATAQEIVEKSDQLEEDARLVDDPDYGDTEFISVRALGEHFYKRFEIIAPIKTGADWWIRIIDKKVFPQDANTAYYPLLEMAVACLGEEEVKKRLKTVTVSR